MRVKRVTVRILGLASTTKGFAFALTEGPARLVSWGLLRMPNNRTKMFSAVNSVLQKSRPLFVTFDRDAANKKRNRGRLFAELVVEACDTHGIMLLDKLDMNRLSNVVEPNKWDIAEAVAKRFPEIAHRLPKRRKIWQSEDDRIGLFQAVAAAVAGWGEFQAKNGKQT